MSRFGSTIGMSTTSIATTTLIIITASYIIYRCLPVIQVAVIVAAVGSRVAAGAVVAGGNFVVGTALVISSVGTASNGGTITKLQILGHPAVAVGVFTDDVLLVVTSVSERGDRGIAGIRGRRGGRVAIGFGEGLHGGVVLDATHAKPVVLSARVLRVDNARIQVQVVRVRGRIDCTRPPVDARALIVQRGPIGDAGEGRLPSRIPGISTTGIKEIVSIGAIRISTAIAHCASLYFISQ